jgi:hypothetical protein
MSDQHAATAVTAAAVIATILVARAVVLQGRRRHPTRVSRPRRGHMPPWAGHAPASSDDAFLAVAEAEDHVHRCWQRLQQRARPPE